MVGHRLPDGFEPTRDWYEKLGITELPKGGYGKDSRGAWCVVTPNGRMGCISKHTVEEHADGTITVSPSILIYPTEGYNDKNPDQPIQRPGWHGFLKRGVWEEIR
jgi:hypothetical protein